MINDLLADSEFQAKFVSPQSESVVETEFDLRAQLRSAFQDPIMYPPFTDSVFAGDTVVIVLQDDLQYPQEVLEALIGQFEESNVSPADISVVISEATAQTLGVKPDVYQLPPETKDEQPPLWFPLKFGFNTIQCQVHDPSNVAGLAYLAANEAGDPVYANRLLVESDVVIPVAAALPGDISRQIDCVYPCFSGVAAQERLVSSEISGLAKRLEVALANDTLGAFFVVQIVDGPGGQLSHVFCGERTRVASKARATANQNWSFDYQGEAEMVVASIESDGDRQTWDDIVEAVLLADRVTTGDGPIVVLSEVKKKPNRAIAKALQAQFEDGPTTGKTTDRLRALASVAECRSVFLKSRLAPSVVEDLGLAPLDSVQQVNRVAEAVSSGLVIRDAHKCQLPIVSQPE